MQITIDQKAGEAYIKCNLKEFAIVKLGVWFSENCRSNCDEPDALPSYEEVERCEHWPDDLVKLNISNADITALVKAFGVEVLPHNQ